MAHCGAMGLPKQPVTLSAEQLADLNRKLADMRHEINGHLALFVAAAELLRIKPDSGGRMMATMSDQPAKISDALKKFSAEFEQALGISRP